MRITNVVKNIFNLLKKSRPAVMAGMILCALGGGAWADTYVYYGGNWQHYIGSESDFALIAQDTSNLEAGTPDANNDNYIVAENLSESNYTALNSNSCKLYIAAGVTYTLSGTNTINADVENAGTIKIASGETTFSAFVQNGTLSISGRLTTQQSFENSGTILVLSGGDFRPSNNFTNSNILTVYQNGNITSNGTIINGSTSNHTATFTNNGTVSANTINNYAILNNTGSLSAPSNLNNYDGGNLTNEGYLSSGNDITNNGTINNTAGEINASFSGSSTGTVNDIPTGSGKYFFHATSDSLWTNTTNWSNSTRPDISGNTTAYIYLSADCTFSSDLTFNNSNTNPIYIYLNGYSLTGTDKSFLLSNKDGNGNESTVHFIGPGTVECKELNSANNPNHYIYLSEGVTFKVNSTIYADLNDNNYIYIIDEDDTCTVEVPASGANMNFGNGNIRFRKSSASGTQFDPKPYGEPYRYTVKSDGASPVSGNSNNGEKITFGRVQGDVSGSINATIFKYDVQIIGTTTWVFNGDEYSSDATNKTVQIEATALVFTGTETKTKDVYLKTKNNVPPAVGDGIIITIRTPDDTMDLAEIRYIQGEMRWTGAADGDFSNLNNWSDGNGVPTVDSWIGASEYVIPGGCPRYPTFNGSSNGVSAVNLPKVTIKNNASITVTGGTVNLTGSLTCEGTGYINFIGGKFNIVQDGNDIKTWKADYPEYSTFNEITFDNSDGTKKTAIFQPESDIYIKTSITNDNGGIFDAQTNHITTYCTGSVTITGGSNASTTKFDTLDCSNAGGKTLTFAGYCSANTLNFTGTSSSSLLTVTGSGAQIEVSADQVGARYLSISDSTVPKISGGAYSVYESTISLSTPNDYTTLIANGWLEGDPSEFIWLGKSTNWNSKSNWSSGMAPIAGSTVKIPAGKSFYPILAADINLGTDSSLLVTDGAKIDLGGKKLSCPSVTINGTLKLNGSEDLSATTFVSIAAIEYYGGTAISYNSAFPTSVSSLTVSGSGTQLTVDSSISASSLKIDTGATLVSGDNSTDSHTITISSLWTNNGTFTPNQSTVTFTDSVTIDGSSSSSFYNLTASGLGGKTLTINQNISVSNDLTLSGTAVDDELVITGNGKKIGISKITDAKWLKVDTSSKAPAVTKTDFTADSDIYIKALFSLFIDNTAKPTGWNIPILITWNGTNSTAWGTASNWTPATASFTNEDEILIPAGCSNYPELTSNVTIKSLTMEADTNTALTVSSGTLTINDTAKLAGTISGNITLSSTTQAFTTDGDITLNDAVITGDIDVDSNTLTTTGSTTLKGDVTSGNEISVQGDLTVEGAVSQPLVFEGSVWQNFTDKSGNNYNIEIKKDDSNGVVFDVGGTITTLKINSLTITKNIDSVTPANGSTTFRCLAEITTLTTTADSGDIIFNADTTLKNDTTFSQNAYLVVANGKTLSAASKKITFAGTGLSTGGKISAASFENTGTLSENAATEYVGDFTNNGTFTVDNAVTVSGSFTNNETFTVNNAITVSGSFTNNGTFTVNNAVTVSGSFTNNTGKTSNINNSLSVNGNFVDNGTISFDTDSGTAGYITLAGVTSGTTQTFTASTTTSAYKIQNKNTSGLTFLNNLTISDYVDDLTATETLTFGDATSDTFTISAATFTRTAGPTVINGKVTGSTLDFGTAPTASAVSVKDGAELSVSAGLTASDLTIEGGTLTSTATSEIELTGTKINTSATLNGGTGGLKLTSAVYNTTTPPTLTTNGKVNISTGKLTSLSIASGNTSLSGAFEIKDITFAASSTLTANNNNITVTGTWDNTAGGTFVPGTGAAGETVTQTVTFTGAASSPAASTVKGPTTFNDVTFNAQVNIENANAFNNLTFTAGASGTITTAQTVNGLTTINNSTNSLSFTNASNIFAGGVKIGDSATGAYAGDITLTGTGASSAPIQLNVDKYANRLTLNSPVELLGNVKVTTTQTYNSTVAINSNSELTAMLATFAGNITGATGATGTTFTVSAQTVIANDITISPTTVTFNNTINDSTAGTHTLTFDSATEVTFTNTIGNDKAIKLDSKGNTIIQTNSINCTNQTYNTIDIQTSTTFSGGQINFNGNISTTKLEIDLSIKNADSIWGQSGTPINVTNLKSINIINDGTTEIALNTENANIGDSSTPELIPFIFSGDSTGTNKKEIYFTPGSTQFGNFEINDYAQLSFVSDFTQYVPTVPRTDPISTDMVKFTINKGNVSVGSNKFVVGYLVVKEYGKFEQTGNNETPTAALQSVYRLENYATNGIIWDSHSDGGALTIIFGTTVNTNTKTIKYNKKNITLYANTVPLEGAFWDLIIPTDVTVTNDNYICVRRNFIIQPGGNYIHSNNPLVFGTDTITGLESALSGDPTYTAIYVDSNPNSATPINLGDVTINASGITKTTDTNSNFLCTNLTITSGTTFAPDSGYDIEISGNFTDDGTLTLGSGKKIIFNGETPSTVKLNAGTTYPFIEINKDSVTENTNTVTFFADTTHTSVKATELTITNAPAVTFQGIVDISTITNPASTGAITFQANTTVTNDVNFNTTGTVTFGDSTTDDDFTFNAITHTAGLTILKGDLTARSAINFAGTTINGTVTSQNSSITLGDTTVNGTITSQTSSITTNKLTLTGDTSVKANTNITINDSISGSDYQLTLDSPAQITLTSADLNELTITDTISPATPTSSIVIKGGEIKTQEPLTIPFDTTLTGSTTLSVKNDGTGSLFFPSTITIDLQNSPLTINAYTQLHGKFTSSTSSSTAAITINNDTIINNTGNTTELNVPLTCQNLVLYNGELKTSANITTTKDLVLYGADYNETDQKSNLGGMYTYKNRFNNTKFEKSALPDGNALPVAPFTGTLTTNGNVTIQAGHNFYANGLTATSDGTPWNLKINKNKNTTANFAEAYYCNFTASPCTVSCYTAGATADSAKIAAEVCTVQTGYEAGWDLADFEITKAYTVHDNLIYIEFNRNVRTADNELTASSTNISRIKYQGDGDSGPQTGYAKVYINENLKTPTALSSPTNVIYLSAHANIPLSENVAGKWNSDASGISSGRSGSKDTHNVSHNSIPYLNIPRNALDGSGSVAYSSFITDEYGKRLLHYYSATPDISAVKHENGYTFTDVSDKSRPVIVAVKTGQELHQVYDAATGESSQHSYDSHNFIEFIYSESVSFGSTDPAVCDIYIPAYDASENNNVQENVRVSSKLGALTGNITAEGQLTFAGLGSIEKGKIHTGKDGATDATVNAFYRDNPYSIKISIAGWTDGTVTDRNGNEFKNWVGYIESAVQPEGKYKLGSTTPLVFDQAGNAQKESDDTITVNSTDDSSTDNVYGNWDISEPVFAPCRLNLSTIWGDKKQSEAVGTGSGSTLDRIEFHLFDNTPAYDENDEAYWFSQKGWCKNDSALTEPVLYDDSYTYCADIIGGARQYDTNAARRTQGGIRFSTTVNNATSFKYSSERSTSPSSSFKTTIDGIYATVQSSIFTGTSDKSRSNDDPDGCYFALGLSETNLPVTAQFTVSYDDSTGYITDLAGNRLRSDLIYTIDRTPPSIDLCLSPINQDKLFIIFVKSLVTDSKDIKYTNNSGSKITINETLEQILPYCFDLIQLDENGNYTQSNDLKIDTSTPAKIELYKPSDYGSESTSEFTFVTLKLNRNLTLKDIETLHLRLYYASQYQELSRDPVTSLNNSRVTFIQDSIGNYTSMYTAHALSDFVIGAVNPLYAYDTGMTYQDEIVMNGLYEEGSWAVHDFEADQQNYGTLPANHPVSIVTQLDDGTTQKDNLPPNVRIFLSNEQDAGSVAGQFNIDFNKQLRVWLPDVTDGEFLGFALNNNTNYSTTDSELLTDNLSDGLIFNVSQDITTTWKDGDQITFLFGLLNSDGTQKRIYNSPYYNTGSNKYDYTKSTAVPLYSMRLHDPSDILSLDLWSFKVHTLTEQRGGVTILNNVINVTNGEKTAVKVNLPKAGKLNVMVTTLDGNIIQYLNHGQTSAGEHYYSWNGKNKAGTPVARGIYFIRVVGNGIDETRKVMVVK